MLVKRKIGGKNNDISFSILYADIVNFTPLSEQLSASNLVKILNELFGRFDQIAQVKWRSFFIGSSSIIQYRTK